MIDFRYAHQSVAQYIMLFFYAS